METDENEEEPNAETLAALSEIRDMEARPQRYPGYTDAGEMMEEILDL